MAITRLSFRNITSQTTAIAREGYWIDPFGKLLAMVTGGFYHHKWIEDNLSRLKDGYDIKSDDCYSAFKEMMDLGFVALREYNNNWIIDALSQEKVLKIPESLKKHIVSSNIPVNINYFRNQNLYGSLRTKDDIIEYLYNLN